MRELIAAEVIDRLPVVRDKLKAGVSHEQIVREGVAEWGYSEFIMGWYIEFTTEQIERAARQRRAMVAALVSVQARKRLN